MTPDPFDLDDTRPRRPTARDELIAAAVREAEANPTAVTCHACGGDGLDDETDDDGPLPCHWCGGDGLEDESLVVEGQVTG